MSPIAPLPTPPSKFDIFMEKFAWPTITLFVGTVLAAVIIAIWLGKIQVVDFSWIMLILGCLMVGTTIFCIWYSITTRHKLQEQYNKNIADIKKNNLTFKTDIRRMREEETHDWHEWAISFSKQADKEHRERTEELKKQCMEAISDAKRDLDVSVKNAQTLFKGSVESYQIAVDLYREQLIHAQKQMQALEERLRKELTPPESTISPTHATKNEA